MTDYSNTIISYTYKSSLDGRVQGPVYIDGPDTGEAPHAQAKRRCDEYGDTVIRAERVDRPAIYRR